MANVRCKDCQNLYSDRLTKCSACGSEFVETDEKARSAALKNLADRNDSPSGLSNPATVSKSDVKLLYAVRSIAIFLLFSFNAGLIFAYAVYSDLTWEFEYSDNPIAWIPWTLGWSVRLVGIFASAMNLAASSPKK